MVLVVQRIGIRIAAKTPVFRDLRRSLDRILFEVGLQMGGPYLTL